MTDAEKDARRRVIDGNKAWRSATTVRRERLAGFAARKTAPEGAPALLGYLVTNGHGDLTRAAHSGHEMACDLLGLTSTSAFTGRQIISDAIEAATPGRQSIITLTVAIAAMEDATDSLRHPIPHIARHLFALESWGYTLAPIKRQAITGRPTPTTTPTRHTPRPRTPTAPRPSPSTPSRCRPRRRSPTTSRSRSRPPSPTTSQSPPRRPSPTPKATRMRTG